MANQALRPQFYDNNLPSVRIDKPTLLSILAGLRAAIKQGVRMMEESYPPDPTDRKGFGSICGGHLGVALTYLRLEHQSAYLRGEDDDALPDFRKLAEARINPYQLDLDIQPGRPSPLTSAALGAALIRIVFHSSTCSDAEVNERKIDEGDFSTLNYVFQISMQQSHAVSFQGHSMGGDEIMAGRTGLLWAISNVQHLVFDEATQRGLEPIFKNLPKLVDSIIDAGRIGAEEYVAENGDVEALPLMWLWFDGCYALSGMHGAAGILTILLTVITASPAACKTRTYLPQIAHTITALSKICISHEGHLPMSIPELPSKTARTSPLVQICHGTPGLLYLLACAMNNREFAKIYWAPEWDESIKVGSEKIWEEGLLSKGGGLCHGIAGNAWPWLVLHGAFEYEDETVRKNITGRLRSTLREAGRMSGDYFLARALAFLLEARKSPPFNTELDGYRMPDKPYGLYEGLAGTICAWAEACVFIMARLKKMEMCLDAKSGEKSLAEVVYHEGDFLHVLGFPTLGGGRVTGFL